MKREGRYTTKPSHTMQSRNFAMRQYQRFRTLSTKKKIAVILVPVTVFLVVTPILTYLVLLRDISDPERLMNRSNTGVQFVDKNDQVFFSTGSNKSLKRLPLSEISDYTETALISSEDKNFYTHSGFSVRAILGAVVSNVSSGGDGGGGSTLTQQLVKNTLLSTERSFLRKYQELFMALAVDRQYSKDEILDMYLNSVYYGEGAFGIDEASKTYFNKSAAELDLAESTMLIGLLPAPGAYSPINGDPKKASQRQAYVLRRMVEDGKVTQAEADAAKARVITYAEVKAVEYPNAPHFSEMVLDQLYDKYGEEKIKRSGYQVKTTLDLGWQKQAEQIVAQQIVYSTPGGGRNAALVAIDPKNGNVRALVGSADYSNPVFGKVNMATTARQPGSSFKPIYVTEAIDQKLVTAATILRDESTDFGAGYRPNNYDFKFRGDITLRNGLAQSLNIPALKVLQKLGVDEAVDHARDLGLSTVDPNVDYGLALGLGAAEAKPIEMTNAYAAFADEGRYHDIVIIDSIKNKYNETIFRSDAKSRRVQSREASFIISDILSDNTARAPSFGGRLNIPGRDVAVKTGSTDDNRDAWTIGYTPSITVGVWVGNNENEVMTAGGSAMAGPIWSKSIQAFLGDTPSESFAQPSGVTKVTACGVSGNGYEEFFISGTIPSRTCEQQTQDTSTTDKDTDGDGVKDNDDKCPTVGGTVGSDGCPKAVVDKDTDGDGVKDSLDKCPATPMGTNVGSDGCPVEPVIVDTDGDGVTDDIDQCPTVAAGLTPDPDKAGCPLPAP